MAKDHLLCGLDIGSTKIATLIATLSQEDAIPKPHIIGVSTIPSRGIRKGQVVDIEETVEAISESMDAAERMAGCSVSDIHLSVGGSHIESQNSHGVVAVGNPKGEINTTDVERVVEAAKAISLPSTREMLHVVPREYVVDGQKGIKDPIGMTGVRLEVDTHIIHAATTNLQNLTKCIREVGVDVAGIVFNGIADAEDSRRGRFIESHLRAISHALAEGIDVRGYLYWSLLDNFEWDKGFWPRFGLVEIDYKTLERKIRPSAQNTKH